MADADGSPVKPPLHLRIAVTGHRTLVPDWRRGAAGADAGDVEHAVAGAIHACAQAVAEVKRKFAEFFDASAPSVTLISALAAGADQVAVRALENVTLPDGFRKRLEAVLPFANDYYAKDMAADEAAAMEGMLRKADAALELNERLPPKWVEAKPGSIGGEELDRWRNQRFAQVGEILVRQADVLVAIWNGVAKSAEGGTAHTIALALREGVPVVWIEADTQEARLLPPARQGDRLVTSRDLARGKNPIDLWAPDLDQNILRMIGDVVLPPGIKIIDDKVTLEAHAKPGSLDYRLNHGHASTPRNGLERYFGTKDHRGEPAPETTRAFTYRLLMRITGSLVGAPLNAIDPLHRTRFLPMTGDWRPNTADLRRRLQAGAFRGLDDRMLETIAGAWAHADAAATRLGHWYRSSYVHTYALASLAVIIGLSGLFAKEKWLFVGLEFLILLAAIDLFQFARKAQVHQRYLQARELAEQFRPAWVLAQLGLGGRRVLDEQATWTAWAAQAWTGAMGLPRLKATPQALATIAERLREDIVDEQMDYHRRNAARLILFHDALERVSALALYGAVLAAFFYLAFDFIAQPFLSDAWHEAAKSTVTFFCAGLPVIAAAAAGMRFQGDFQRFAQRSDATHKELVRLSKALTDFTAHARADQGEASLFAELRDLVLQIEAVLISDLEDWRFVYRARPNPEP